jgi:hypothetical protein
MMLNPQPINRGENVEDLKSPFLRVMMLNPQPINKGENVEDLKSHFLSRSFSEEI